MPPSLSEAGLQQVLTGVCRQAGLDPDGAALIKFTNNAVFKLAAAPVVVRIAGSKTIRERIQKVIEVARWLEERGLPAVRLLSRKDQPVEHAGHLATLWHAVPDNGPTPTGDDLGRILRTFHGLPNPGLQIPRWQPLTAIRTRLAEAEWLHVGDRVFLHDQCQDLEHRLRSIETVLPVGPIHGDSFLGNLIPAPNSPVICDFDSVSIGPREWDLTPVAVGKVRFDYRTDAHARLAATYGFDVMSWSGFDLFRRLRELQLVTSVLPVIQSNLGLVDEWRHRLTSFRNGDSAAVWHPYT